MMKIQNCGGAEFKLEKLDDNGDVDESFTAITATTSTDETSDDYGTLIFGDLEYGTYQITETKAPDGYNLSTEVYEITISEDKDVDISLTAENRKMFSLPFTGGSGIYTYICWIILIILAINGGRVTVFISSRKIKRVRRRRQRTQYIKRKGKHSR